MLIDIKKIKIKDRIRKDFGNIQELADDIRENGLINPPVITPDTYELIAGERRLRAMKLLGYKQIEVRPMTVKDAEHQLNLEISENESRKELTKSERIDYARQLERIESAKAKKRMSLGGQGKENFPTLQTRDAVASQLGIGSGRQYEKEKYIVENQSSLTPKDFDDWDEGKLSTNKAFKKIKEQKELLEKKVLELEFHTPKVRVVDNTDYSLEDKIKKLQKQITNLQKEKSDMELLNRTLKSSKESTENLMNSYKKESEEYIKLKNDISKLGLQPDGTYNILDLSKDITTLAEELETLLTTKLSPMRYSKILPVVQSNNALKRNMENIIYMVNDWCKSMANAIGVTTNEIIIDMEEVNEWEN